MAHGGHQQLGHDPPRSYVGHAIISFILYYLGFWVVGLILNILFLSEARTHQRRTGQSPAGVGCLWLLIAVHVVLPLALVAIALVVVMIALAVGLLSMSDLPI